MAGNENHYSFGKAHRVFNSFHRIIHPKGVSANLLFSQKILSALDESGVLDG